MQLVFELTPISSSAHAQQGSRRNGDMTVENLRTCGHDAALNLTKRLAQDWRDAAEILNFNCSVAAAIRSRGRPARLKGRNVPSAALYEDWLKRTATDTAGITSHSRPASHQGAARSKSIGSRRTSLNDVEPDAGTRAARREVT